MKKIYFSCIEITCRIIQYLVSIILIFMALLMFAEVVRRYFFGMQYAWSEELIRFLAMWIAFLGGAAAYREKSLVCFDLISGKMKGKVKFALEMLCNTFVLIFLILIFYLGIQNVFSPSTYKQVAIGLKVSMSFPYAAIPVGTGLMILFTLNNYFDIIGRRLKKESIEKGDVV